MTRAEPRAPGGRSLVAIDGLDGSGKSRFAGALASACEAEGAPAVFLFRVDDFRRPLADIPAGADEAAIYYERYYDFALLDDCLRRFLGGAPGVSIPRFDPDREILEGTRELQFGGAGLALLEGVFVLRSPTVATGTLVLLEVTEEEARRRILARDTARGRSDASVEHRMNNRYFPAQRAYRAAFDPLRRADVVIDNEQWGAPRLLRPEEEEMMRVPALVGRALRRVVPS
jgi:uridine kinase